MSLTDKLAGAVFGFKEGGQRIKEVADDAAEALENKTSESGGGSLTDLELFFEDRGWIETYGPLNRWNFTRSALRKITSLARVMYMINPLIKRAVTVQELYVWSKGVEIKAEDPDVQLALDDFFNDPKNQKCIGEAWPEREREQRIDGNNFFAHFVNKRTGAIRVRSIPFDLIESVVRNPEDPSEVRFYKKVWNGGEGLTLGLTGEVPTDTEPVYYPDMDYNPKTKPATYEGVKIDWTCRILHNKSGSLPHMVFGVSELASVLGWATSYKKVLDDFATTLHAYARMAMKMTGLAGKKGIAAAKSKFNSGVTQGHFSENNPPPNTASWAFLSGNVDVAPIKTAHSTTAPDEARALRTMVASGTDTPEHFFGDSDVGNFATSETLDRPTEMKMVLRQTMWSRVALRQSNFAIIQSCRAPEGRLRQAGFRIKVVADPFDGSENVIITPPDGRSTKVTVVFPNILERDVTDRVRAVVQAATLGGSPAEGIIPDRKFLFYLLMVALGEKDATDLMNKYYPESVTQGFADPKDKVTDDRLIAQGRKELGDAALISAKTKPTGDKAKPKPSGSPMSGGSASS